MNDLRDVIVVGAGPAGLATAMHARERDLSVTVIEQRDFPIDKACGEGLMPGAVAQLEDLGIQVGGRSFTGIAYIDAQHRAEAEFTHGCGRGVRRTWLQEAMHQRARQLGVEFVGAKVHDVEQQRDRACVAGIEARYVVGADGLHSTVRRVAGIAARSPGTPRFGLRRHYDVAPWSTMVEVHWARGAEAYVTPVSDHCVGIAILTGRGAGFDDHLVDFPELHDRVAGAGHGATLGAGPLRQTVSGRSRGRVALVGDAAGYVDALTGEGINVGLAEALALADCLAADDLGTYEQRWHEATRKYRRLTSALLWARQNALLGDRIVPAAARFPGLFTRAVQQLA